jgi:phosphatidylglycerophosphatase A
MNALKKLVITGLGTGYLPVAPGTWGSAVVAGGYWLIAVGASGRQICLSGSMAVVFVLSAVACVLLGRFAQTALGRKDPSQCTIDEFAGQSVALVLLPLAGGPVGSDALRWALPAGVGFLCFRGFDIVKPPPVRRLEKLPYGTGVLLDDVLAGVYANLTAQLILRLGLGMH